MKPTRKQLEKQIQENYQLIQKLETELREICCKPESLYAVKIKSEQRYFNWSEGQLMAGSTETPKD